MSFNYFNHKTILLSVLLLLMCGVLWLFIPTLQSPFLLPKTAWFIFGILAIGGWNLYRRIIRFRVDKQLTVFDVLVVGIVLTMIVSSLVSHSLEIALWGSIFRYHGFFLWVSIFIWMYCIQVYFQNYRDVFIIVLVLAMSTVSLYGLYQYIVFDSLIWDTNFIGGRIFSTLGQPNFLAYSLILVLPLFYYLYKKYCDYRSIIICFAVVSISILVLTLSRAAWVGIITACILYLIYRYWQKYKITLVICLFFVSVIAASLLVFGSDLSNTTQHPVLRRIVRVLDVESPTVQSRFLLWEGAIQLIADHPWFGMGQDQMYQYSPQYIDPKILQFESSHHIPDRFHNLFLDIAAQFGLVGLFLWVLFLGYIGHLLLSHIKKSVGYTKLFYEMVLVSFMAYFIALQFGFMTIGDMVVFFGLVGLVIDREVLPKRLSSEPKNLCNPKIFAPLRFAIGLVIVMFVLSLQLSFVIRPVLASYHLQRGITHASYDHLQTAFALSHQKSFISYYLLEHIRQKAQFDYQNGEGDVGVFTSQSQKYLASCFLDAVHLYLCHLTRARYFDTLSVVSEGVPDFYAQALDDYNRVLEYNPLFIRAYLEKGLIYLKLGDCLNALDHLYRYKNTAGKHIDPSIDDYISWCKK